MTQLTLNKEEVNSSISEAKLVIFGGPKQPFTESEFQTLQSYIQNGGSVLVMLGEGGEQKSGTNINYLLEQF